jgi:DNA-directed RNA polymerase specialized sigma24 family protein
MKRPARSAVNGTPKQQTNDHFKRAAERAKAGDPVGMLAALADEHALDGYYRYFAGRYKNLPGTAIEEAISAATDEAYAQLQGGRRILNLGAWLWKVIENRLNDAWTSEHALRQQFDDARHADAQASDLAGARQDRGSGVDRDKMRAEAIRVARELLPSLGHTNIEKVMKMLFDAAEQGVEDLPHEQIAEALDLKASTVRVLVWRGFQRLARKAAERGLHVDRTQLKNLFPDLPDDEPLDEIE